MSVMGGFFGAFALMSAAERFGSAMTGNLLDMMIHLAGRNTAELLSRFGALLVYIAGLILADLLQRHTKICMKKACLAADTAGLLLSMVLMRIDAALHPLLEIYPVFFVTAFQWGGYGEARGFSSSSLFSTNNLKQCITAFTEFAVTKDPAMRVKGCFYLVTLLAFLLGGFLGAVCVYRFAEYGALAGLLPLLTAALLLRLKEKAAPAA